MSIATMQSPQGQGTRNMKQANYSGWNCSGWLGCIAVAAMSVLAVPGQLLAADGDIILTRQVQPRAAVRPPVVPDPNPRVVNPKPSSYVGEGLHMRSVPGELSDSDFAAVTSGTRMTQQLLAPTGQGRHANAPGLVNHASGAGNNPVGHSGGAVGNIDGQVNRSIEQGLRPLQLLQRP